MAWIAERKVNYRSDPKLKKVNPGTFHALCCSASQIARVRRGERAIR
jgi:hypothetical protein